MSWDDLSSLIGFSYAQSYLCYRPRTKQPPSETSEVATQKKMLRNKVLVCKPQPHAIHKSQSLPVRSLRSFFILHMAGHECAIKVAV